MNQLFTGWESLEMESKISSPQQSITGKSLELLQAINESAATFQRSAHSETAVFRAYQEQMANLKLRGGLSLLDESGENLTVKVVNYAGRIGKILSKFEKLIGKETKDFTFVAADVDVYHRVVAGGQTQYIADSSRVIAQMIPKSAQRYLGRIIIAFGSSPAIYAPIISSEGKVKGVINIVGDGLTSDDVPALTAFANHIAVALDNASLFEEIQKYASDLEKRVAERTQELAAANERLKELDRLKSKLISNVSHELRTPITNLELYLNLYKHGKLEKKEQYLRVIEEQSRRLKELVEGILDLSRLDAGKDEFEFLDVQLNDVVEPIAMMLQEKARTKDLTLTFVPDGHLAIIQGNQSQLAQIAVNLITNSINYSNAGRITVQTLNNYEDAHICLKVSDTGKGIADEDRPHIFDRFYRGLGSGQNHVPGTGLGLAIVKEIVEIHSGKIEFESEVGKGTTFRVWLPIEQQKNGRINSSA